MSEGEGQGFSVILWQLQQYQHVIRNWDRHLDPYEFKVIMQILDRTIGWKKNKATFRPSRMLEGDTKYGGFGRTISRSKLMKVLSSLEERGMIARRWDPQRPGLKSYSVNLKWEPQAGDQRSSTGDATNQQPERSPEGVSVRHRGVRQTDRHEFPGDFDVSNRDPEESYRDNAIIDGYHDYCIGVDPRPSASDQRALDIQPGTGLTSGNARFQTAPSINPPPRKRRAG